MEPSVPRADRRFGEYQLLDKIGDGGMAEIYLAKKVGYSGFEKLVALKRILERYSRNPSFARLLVHEAKLAARISHLNVVQVLDLGEADGQVYIAMEYVRGRDLAAILSSAFRRGENLPVALSLFVASEFLTGLDYAHRLVDAEGRPLGLIHRDISPQNILVSSEGEVKVTDFGIARVWSKDYDLPANLQGKYGYMSPEQARGEAYDQRSDIFSAGVVLHEMLVGRRLFRAATPSETIERVRSQPIPAPSSLHSAVPEELDRICLRALARRAEDRYQTVGSMLGDLLRVKERLGQGASRHELVVYMRRQFGRGVAPRPSAPPPPFEEASPYSPPPSGRVPLGEVLVGAGLLRREELEIALAEQRSRGGRIGELLAASGRISEAQLAWGLSQQSGVPLLAETDLRARRPEDALLARLPREIAEASVLVPISVEGGVLELVVADPFDKQGVLEAQVAMGATSARLRMAPASAVRDAIRVWYRSIDEESAGVPRPVVVVADPDREGWSGVVERLLADGIEVAMVADARGAREVVRAKHPVMLVVSQSLPGAVGPDLLAELKAEHPRLSVFVLAAQPPGAAEHARAIDLGAEDVWSRPIAVEIFASKLRRELYKRSASGSSAGVGGSLLEMPLLDVLRSLELTRMSAHVALRYEDGRVGALAIEGGALRAAQLGEQAGPEAFYGLALPGPGLFRIDYRRSALAPNLSLPNTVLFLEAIRRIEASSAVARRSASALGLGVEPHAIQSALSQRAGSRSAPITDFAIDPPSLEITQTAFPAPPRRPGGAAIPVIPGAPAAPARPAFTPLVSDLALPAAPAPDLDAAFLVATPDDFGGRTPSKVFVPEPIVAPPKPPPPVEAKALEEVAPRPGPGARRAGAAYSQPRPERASPPEDRTSLGRVSLRRVPTVLGEKLEDSYDGSRPLTELFDEER